MGDWATGVGLDQAAQAQQLLEEAAKVVVLLVVLEQLRMLPPWLFWERVVDHVSIQARAGLLLVRRCHVQCSLWLLAPMLADVRGGSRILRDFCVVRFSRNTARRRRSLGGRGRARPRARP